MQFDQQLTIFHRNLESVFDENFPHVEGANVLISVFVKLFEHFNQLFILLCLHDAFDHEVAKFIEVDFTVFVWVLVLNHLRYLFFGAILSELAHDRNQLCNRNDLVVIDIEHFKDTFEIVNLLICEIFPQFL